MSADARAAILARLRSARATARLPRVDGPEPRPGASAAGQEFLLAPRASTAECVDRFLREAVALGVECWHEPTSDAVRARVAALVGGRRALAWEAAYLPYDVGEVLDTAMPAGASRAEQAEAEVGITGCDAAIAETGTLVLTSGPGKSRLVSLLPPLHVAVLSPAELCVSMAEFFERHAARLGDCASCTFVTGPSRTADIELTLTLGIHGPGRVAVVIGP
jgi:L-lactate dehydrogenase complex protein LldG